MFKVLIVEDDPMVTMINEQFVNRNSQFRVIKTCNDGKAALRFLENNDVDLIIMDVFMPHMNGIETLKNIRKSEKPVSVIMVTAANDIPTFEEAMQLGAVDYLVKPFSFDRFQQALDKFAKRSELLKDGKPLNQGSIDQILSSRNKISDDIPKGIQEKTKSVILKCLAEHKEWLTGEDIANCTGLSAVTVRRYMNHLVQTGDISGVMNYETGGRPCMMYKIRG